MQQKLAQQQKMKCCSAAAKNADGFVYTYIYKFKFALVIYEQILHKNMRPYILLFCYQKWIAQYKWMDQQQGFCLLHQLTKIYCQVSNISCTLERQFHCWSLRCSSGIAYQRCSNYIFILHLTVGFNILCKENCKPRWETFKLWDLARLMLEILWYWSKLLPVAKALSI